MRLMHDGAVILAMVFPAYFTYNFIYQLCCVAARLLPSSLWLEWGSLSWGRSYVSQTTCRTIFGPVFFCPFCWGAWMCSAI